jgi:hypothetical protein
MDDAFKKNVNGMVLNTKPNDFQKHKMIREKSIQQKLLMQRIEKLEKQVKYLYEHISKEEN